MSRHTRIYNPLLLEKALLEKRKHICRSCANSGIGLGGRRCPCLNPSLDSPKKPETVDDHPALSFDDLLKQAADAFGKLLISRNKWARMAWARKRKIQELESRVSQLEKILDDCDVTYDLSGPAEELTECGHPRAQVEASQQMRNGPPGVGDVVWACYCPKCGKEWDE